LPKRNIKTRILLTYPLFSKNTRRFITKDEAMQKEAFNLALLAENSPSIKTSLNNKPKCSMQCKTLDIRDSRHLVLPLPFFIL
jgi:hypothetical protein